MTSRKSFPQRFTKIDRLTISNHRYLTKGDECYYLGEYASRQGYAYSYTNNLVLNFKKSVDRRGKPEWAYKGTAIKEIANAFGCGLAESTQLLFGRGRGIAYVPVPPSYAKGDPLYDSRLVDMLKMATCPTEVFTSWQRRDASIRDPRLDVKEWVRRLVSAEPSHSGNRLTPQELAKHHQVIAPPDTPSPRIIAVVDDVITEGAHYVAMRNLLSARFPKAQIIGLFVARSVWV